MSEEIKDPQLVDETKLPEEETNCQSNTSPNAEGEELADTTPDALSPEERLQSELDKLKDAHLRLVAEYDNYRKRTLKEKSELIRSGGEKVLTELLPVVDDLDIALQNLVMELVALLHAVDDLTLELFVGSGEGGYRFVKQGYKLHDKVLRHASVVVGQ